jgi:hypothetical protein
MWLGRGGYGVVLGVCVVACGGMTGLNEYAAGGQDSGSAYTFSSTGGGFGSNGDTGGIPGTGVVHGTGGLLGPSTGGEFTTCGNGRIDPGEACDGPVLGSLTCASATMGARPVGLLRCSSTCTVVLTGCSQSFGGGGFTGAGGTQGAGGARAFGPRTQ